MPTSEDFERFYVVDVRREAVTAGPFEARADAVGAITDTAAETVVTQASVDLADELQSVDLTFETGDPAVDGDDDTVEGLLTDGGESRPADAEQAQQPEGALDHDFDKHERSTRDMLLREVAEATKAGEHSTLSGGDIAIDLVTRQPLYVNRKVATSVVEYYEDEEFDLASYKTHPYLPVSVDDPVYECVFVSRSVEQLHSVGTSYDFPAGRLARVPVEQAWEGED